MPPTPGGMGAGLFCAKRPARQSKIRSRRPSALGVILECDAEQEHGESASNTWSLDDDQAEWVKQHEVDAPDLVNWIQAQTTERAAAAYEQIEAHYDMTKRMAPAMLRIPGGQRLVPVATLITYTPRFLTSFEFPSLDSEVASWADGMRASQQVSSSNSELPTPAQCCGGAQLGQGHGDGEAGDMPHDCALSGLPANGIAEGPDLFAAVISGDVPARLSAAQALALITAAQYFLAEDLLEPLGRYVQPVIATLDVSLGGALLHAIAIAVGAGTSSKAQGIILRLFKTWWPRLGSDERSPTAPAMPSPAECTTALRALMTGMIEHHAPLCTSSIPQSVFSALSCERDLPRGLQLVFAVLAAAGCDGHCSPLATSTGASLGCPFAANGLPRFVSSKRVLLYELRVRHDVRTVLLDALVTLVAQRQGPCTCAADLLRGLVDVTAAQLSRAPALSIPDGPPCQIVEVARDGVRAAYLTCSEFKTPPHTDEVQWCGNVGFAGACVVGDDRTTEVGAHLQVKRSAGCIKLVAQCAVLPVGAAAAKRFELAAQRWVHSDLPGACSSLRAEWGYVGSWVHEWSETCEAVGCRSLAGFEPGFWCGLDYTRTPGEKFVCAWLCEADGCQLP